MSINLTCGIQHICQRLSFGVPLEDVFPEGEIHPGLNDLFKHLYENVVNSGYCVEEVLSLQGSLQERLKLKERLVLCNDFTGLKISPGALFWVVRHFIGLLPTTLIPQYGDGREYCWETLCKSSKESLANYATRGRNNAKLVENIAEQLLRLPTPNFLLVATLLNFLRRLAVLPKGEPKINKNSVFALVKYFTSSMFVRPYRPGSITKAEKKYYPLMLFSILKWPALRRIFRNTSNYSFALPLEEQYIGYKSKLQPPEFPYYLSKVNRDNTTQTSAVMDKNKSEQQKTLVRIVPPSYHDFEFLRDIACQTEPLVDYDSKRLKRDDKWGKQIEKQVIFMRNCCCCTYSTNYETNNEPESQKSQFDDSISHQYGWNLDMSRSDDDKDEPSQLLSPISEFTGSANYSYDSYSRFNLMCDTQNSETVYEKVKMLDPIGKQDKHNQNEALKEKFSKMGWTYTSPIETLSETAYDIRKSLNEELKDKLAKINIQEECNNSNDIKDDEKRLKGGEDKYSPITKAKLIKVRSRLSLSVSKIKSKFNFIPIFNNNKVKTKKCKSCERVNSKVKYQKMGSVSSIL